MVFVKVFSLRRKRDDLRVEGSENRVRLTMSENGRDFKRSEKGRCGKKKKRLQRSESVQVNSQRDHEFSQC